MDPSGLSEKLQADLSFNDQPQDTNPPHAYSSNQFKKYKPAGQRLFLMQRPLH